VRGLCLPDLCNADADCPKNRRCLLGSCRKQLPCGGHCAPGEACAARVDRCVAVAGGKTCKAGRLAVFDNELDHLAEGCAGRPRHVSCQPLPALAAGQYGMPAQLLKLGSGLAAVAYDTTRGDLVLARHSAVPPHARVGLHHLAGVPGDAPVVGDPHGPRGGIAAPGPNAGAVLAAAEAPSGGAHAVYTVAGAAELRYLAVDAAGNAARHHAVLSGHVGAVSLTTDGEGRPLLAAFTAPAAGSDAAGPRVLTVLRSDAVAPSSKPGWQGGAWLTTQLPAAPDRPCAAAGPRGAGAHLSVAVRGEHAAVAAYDAVEGALHLLRGKAGSKPTKVTLSPTSVPGGSADVGRFASIALTGDGRARIACQDADRGRLLLVQENTVGGPLQANVVDDGVRADGHHRVGADAALIMAPDGGVVIAYQDTRSATVNVVRVLPSGKAVGRTALATDRAAGFSAGVVAVGTKAMVVGAARLRIVAGGDLSVDYALWPVAVGAP